MNRSKWWLFVDVAAIVPLLGLLVLFVHSVNTGAGRVSPADTAILSEERSAPASMAAIMAR